MKFNLMKKVTLLSCLSLSIFAWSDSHDIHFQPDIERSCDVEVRALGCGTPTDSNQDSFIKCVDKKVNNLSQACQEMHQAIRAARSSDHSH